MKGNERADALAKVVTKITLDTHLPVPREIPTPPTPDHSQDNRIAQTAPTSKRIPSSQQIHTSSKTLRTLNPYTP